MGRMSEELEKRLDENKYELYNALKAVLDNAKQLHTCGTSDPTFPCLGCDIEENVTKVVAKIEGVR